MKSILIFILRISAQVEESKKREKEAQQLLYILYLFIENLKMKLHVLLILYQLIGRKCIIIKYLALMKFLQLKKDIQIIKMIYKDKKCKYINFI